MRNSVAESYHPLDRCYYIWIGREAVFSIPEIAEDLADECADFIACLKRQIGKLERAKVVANAAAEVHRVSNQVKGTRDPDEQFKLLWDLGWGKLRDLEEYRDGGAF